MMATAQTMDYLRGIAAQQADQPSIGEPDWLAATRRHAVDLLRDASFPDRTDEVWRYTRLTPLLKHQFKPWEKSGSLPQYEDIEKLLLPGHEDYHRLVFVNGRLATELSNRIQDTDGVQIRGLNDALGRSEDGVLQRLGSLTDDGGHFFSMLNTASISDGALIKIPQGQRLEKPIELIQVTVGGDDPVITHPRYLVALEAGAQATLIERYVSLGSSVYFNNIVSEIFLENDAVLNHQRLQEESSRAFHLAGLNVLQAETSRYRVTSAALGAAWSRTEFNVAFSGHGGDCELQGLYLAGDRQLVDFHVDVRHDQPGCSSREHFKGLLDGNGVAVFDGRIRVEQGAQKTDARLVNDNLMLSRSAEIDTKPQLEIYADDVQCSHGTTVGEIDSDMLFYLRSRGISDSDARRMICLGFAGEILETFTDEALRAQAERLLHQRLDKPVLSAT